jgi:hypothetical protein
MGGLAYKVPGHLPGHIKNVKWTADIGLDKGISFSWEWSAAVYSQLGAHAGLDIKPSDSKKDHRYNNSDEAGTPENYTRYLISGATGNGKNEYTGKHSGKKNIDCKGKDDHHDDDDDDGPGHGHPHDGNDKPITKLIRTLRSLLPFAALNQGNDHIEILVSPNPSINHFNLTIRSKTAKPSTIIVTDILGKVWERHDNVGANSTLQLGRNLKTGVYFIAVVQGNQRRTVMVVKAL